MVLSLATSCAIFAASINFNEPAEDFTRVNPEFNKNIVLSYNSSIADAKKSVVNISTTKTVSNNAVGMNDMFSDPFFKDFFGFQFNIPQEKQKSNSLGSGVVISDWQLSDEMIREAGEFNYESMVLQRMIVET